MISAENIDPTDETESTARYSRRTPAVERIQTSSRIPRRLTSVTAKESSEKTLYNHFFLLLSM